MVDLPPQAFSRILVLAQRDRRDPRQQAAVLLEQAVGARPPGAPASSVQEGAWPPPGLIVMRHEPDAESPAEGAGV